MFAGPIVSGKRKIDFAGPVQLCQQRLVNGDVTALKPMGRAGNVKTPDAISYFVDQTERFSVMRFQAGEPMAQRERVMLSQILHVANLEPGRLCRTERDREWGDIAIRKNILLDE